MTIEIKGADSLIYDKLHEYACEHSEQKNSKWEDAYMYINSHIIDLWVLKEMEKVEINHLRVIDSCDSGKEQLQWAVPYKMKATLTTIDAGECELYLTYRIDELSFGEREVV